MTNFRIKKKYVFFPPQKCLAFNLKISQSILHFSFCFLSHLKTLQRHIQRRKPEMGFAKYVINDSSIIFLFSKSKVSFFIFLINIYIYICLCNTLFYSYINNACMWYWALFKHETEISIKIFFPRKLSCFGYMGWKSFFLFIYFSFSSPEKCIHLEKYLYWESLNPLSQSSGIRVFDISNLFGKK